MLMVETFLLRQTTGKVVSLLVINTVTIIIIFGCDYYRGLKLNLVYYI